MTALPSVSSSARRCLALLEGFLIVSSLALHQSIKAEDEIVIFCHHITRMSPGYMASPGDEPVCPNHGVSEYTKDGFVEVTIDIPGLKTKKKGLLGKKRIVDEAHCCLDVTFGDAAVEMSAEITKGLKAGRKFKKTIEIKEMKVPSIQTAGNYYEVEDDTVRIYVKK